MSMSAPVRTNAMSGYLAKPAAIAPNPSLPSAAAAASAAASSSAEQTPNAQSTETKEDQHASERETRGRKFE